MREVQLNPEPSWDRVLIFDDVEIEIPAARNERTRARYISAVSSRPRALDGEVFALVILNDDKLARGAHE